MLLILISNSVFSAVFIANSSLDSVDNNPGNGVCADINGRCSLRAAIQETNALVGADTVILPRFSTYNILFPYGELSITDSLTLRIADPGLPITSIADMPVIDGKNVDRVFHITGAADVTIFGLFITNGNAIPLNAFSSQSGGGILVENVTNFNLLNSVLYSNKANTGGGISTDSVNNVLISFSDISFNLITDGNTNADGAAIYHNSTGQMKIQNSFIHNNFKDATVPQCRNAIINRNTDDDMYVFSSTISHNSGIGNTCMDGIYAQNGNLYLVNTTIIGNGNVGISFFDSPPNNYNLFVRNSIIADNANKDCDVSTGIINFGDIYGGHNLISDLSCTIFTTTGNLLNTNPQLSVAKSIFPTTGFLFNYYEPLFNSPAIDQGSNLPVNVGNPNACQMYDQLFRVRPIDGNGDGNAICDIGAVEYLDLIFKNGFQ